ncbi:DUF5333 domain-containing protein [Celeribacter indicus]|uniref:NADH dehydrogenase subunit E n=1 Tax=Celeribacter indicus TaxID=1208324 RepID=A0A0B5DYV2_9RHOB|nr:DUF5333 domain-containing protein [Celeribacter indicus]AJE48154.1 hypothetical protein P73_3439 [Celeribacter indicus]SDW33938.1 hypothetical protein SAMN05443573_102438 [Celeribacter indicus]
MIRHLAYPALIALMAAPASAAPITEDPEIKSVMIENMIVTELTSLCPGLAPRTRQVNAQAKSMLARITEKGYGADEVQALQDPAYLAELSRESDAFFAANGVEKRNTEAMCAFGKAQIAARSPLGKLMKNR